MHFADGKVHVAFLDFFFTCVGPVPAEGVLFLHDERRKER